MPKQYDVRGESGTFAPTISDEDLWAIYERVESTKAVSKETGLAPRSVRQRLAKIRAKMGDSPDNLDVDRAEKFDRLVASIPLLGPGGATLKEASVKLYGIGAKDELTQKIVKEGLDSTGAIYRFDKPPLDVVPYDSPIRAYALRSPAKLDGERVFIWGDSQLGFWSSTDPNTPQKVTFTAFHDEAAIDVQMQALALYAPTRVVIIGDFIDFPQLSQKFQQEPEFQSTLQASIKEAHDLLKKIRETVGSHCEIDYVLGNHETRMTRAIVNNNPALYKLTRPGDRYPVYSVQNLLRFEERNVECSAEYPSGEVWMAKRTGSIPGLVATHADPKKRDLRADVVHGHLVQPGIWTYQVHYEDGPVTYTVMCVSGTGNYSDTPDRVRLTRTVTPSGRSRMPNIQSFGTIEIDAKSGLRTYGLHIIREGSAAFHGRVLSSRLKKAS